MDNLAGIATVLTIAYFIINGAEIVTLCRRKVQDVPIFPFISTFINAVLWTKYGLVVDDLAIITVNGFGIVTSLLAIYVHLLHYSLEAPKNENKLILALLLLLGFFGAIHLGWFGGQWVALTACASSILMYGAPLLGLGRIVRSQDSSILSLPLIGVTLAVCLTWLLYGLQTADAYVVVPNLMGTTIALVQLGVCAWFHPSWSFGLMGGAGEKLSPKPRQSLDQSTYEMVELTAAVV